MRTLLAVTLFVLACGGTKPKSESSIVSEGSDTAPTCCCKTIPSTAEKEIIPVYSIKGRMECSTDHGDCVDNVQCNGQQQPTSDTDQSQTSQAPANKDNVPPPPVLGPSGTGDAVPR